MCSYLVHTTEVDNNTVPAPSRGNHSFAKIIISLGTKGGGGGGGGGAKEKVIDTIPKIKG